MTAITIAARLLREAAAELKNAHTLGGDWGNEHEALDAYNQHMATATTLEHMARQCLAQIEEPSGAAPAAVAGPVLDVRAIAAAVCQRVAELPDRNSPEDWPEAMLVTGQELIDVVTCELEQAQAAPALEAPAALLTKPALVGGGSFGVGVPERYVIEAAQRHHEREGQREAMTAEQFADEERKRRTLWELIHGPLAAAPQAPDAPSYPTKFGPNDWVMDIAGVIVKLEEWEPGAVKAHTIYGKRHLPHQRLGWSTPDAADAFELAWRSRPVHLDRPTDKDLAKHWWQGGVDMAAPAAPVCEDCDDTGTVYDGKRVSFCAAGCAASVVERRADAAAPAAPAEGEVLVEVIGLTGSGKSAICGEIEILCRALGLDVSWPDGDPEKNMTHAEWTAAIEAYKPRVRIVERNVPRQSNGGPAK